MGIIIKLLDGIEKALTSTPSNTPTEETTFQPQSPASPEKKEEKKKEWKDPQEPLKYVCNGAKIQCKYCDQPITNLAVTTESIFLQDKLWATVGDKKEKKTILFKGKCLHPSQQKPLCSPPPCQGIMKLDDWQNYSETIIGDHNALLAKSKIKCMISGEDLEIIHSGQMAILTPVSPFSMEPNASSQTKTTKEESYSDSNLITEKEENAENQECKVLDAYWMYQKTTTKKYKVMEFNEVNLYIETVGYEEGQKVTLKIECEQERCFKNGSKEMEVSGIVDKKGIAVVKGLRIEYK